MTATQLSLKLRSRICNWLFHQRRTDVFNENMINTFIAYDTWLKTPFCTLNAGGESPLGTQKTPPPFSLLSKSGVSLYGQICSHELMSTLSSTNNSMNNVKFRQNICCLQEKSNELSE